MHDDVRNFHDYDMISILNIFYTDKKEKKIFLIY